jgi:polyhydroxyalkanoate synthesis regulator phasin
MSGTDAAPAGGEAEQPGAPGEAAEGGLFDLAETPPEAETETGETAKAGERPAWLPEQFWDAEKRAPRVEAMAKAVADLRARLAKPAAAAPESPDAYRLPEVEGLPKDAVKADDPVWGAVRKAAHEAGVSQAQMEAIARAYLTEAARRQGEAGESKEARDAAYAAELARLGPRGRQVLYEVKTWVEGLVGRGMLTQEEARAAFSISNADGVRFLAKMRAMSGEKAIPVDALEDGRMSLADARRMMDEAVAKRDQSLGERAAKALRELAARGIVG